MKVTFNTGRLYTAEGQVIHAEWDAAERRAYFNDTSRGITGSFSLAQCDSPSHLHQLTMLAYDNLMYDNEAWAPSDRARQPRDPRQERR